MCSIKEFNPNLKNTEISSCSKDSVIIYRSLFGKTQRDKNIEKLPIDNQSVILIAIIKSIRFYQNHISQKLGNRCVYDPSCSHYAELAFREKGVVPGTILTLKRLYRCNPKNGGVDKLN